MRISLSDLPAKSMGKLIPTDRTCRVCKESGKDAGETKFMLAMNSRENLAMSCFGTVTNVANGHVDFKVVTKFKV